MTSTLVCDGDSWTWGFEVRDPAFPEVNDDSPENDPYRLSHIWPTLLGQKLNAEVVNLSMISSDNQSISIRTIDYLMRNYVVPRKPVDDVIVVVGWSSPERRRFWLKDGQESRSSIVWPRWRPTPTNTVPEKKFWEHWVTYMDNPEDYILQSLTMSFQMQEFLKRYGFRFVQYNSFFHVGRFLKDWPSPSWDESLGEFGREAYRYTVGANRMNPNVVQWKNFSALLDEDTFLGKSSGLTFHSYIDENLGHEGYYDYHPNEAGHALWSEYLYSQLKELYALDQTSL